MSVLRTLAVARNSLLVVATVVATGACSSYGPLVEDMDPSALFQTDSLSYKLDARNIGYIGAIDVRFTNRTADTTYFINCNGTTGVTLQKLVDGEWRDAYSPARNDCLSPPIAVPPGGTANLPIPVFSGYPGNNFFPKFSVDDIPGVYRAMWTAAVTSYHDGRGSFGNPLPLEHRVSNRFALRLSPR
ncbi:MAG: hypothetical protein H0W42_03150 [Gemmatimonadaceae bacterium]|nr:hypothetical protein [Gemmatimonadaceae bacterium]